MIINKEINLKNIEEYNSLLKRAKDNSLVNKALHDEERLEDLLAKLADLFLSHAAVLSTYSLRVGELFFLDFSEDETGREVSSMDYCLVKLLIEFERFDENISELSRAKERLKQMVFEVEKLTYHPSDNTPTKAK